MQQIGPHIYKQYRHVAAELDKYADDAKKVGLSTGSKTLDQLISVKRGYPWFIGGEPGHGKSEFVIELLVSFSMRYGWKHLCYFGENEVKETMADICSKLVGRPYIKRYNNAMDEADRQYAHLFIDEHFVFMEFEKAITYTEFLKRTADVEKELGYKFDTVTLDPWNDIDYEHGKYPNVSYWLQEVLTETKRASAENNRIDIIVNHVANIPYATDPDTKARYTPIALPNEWEGGRMWNRKAFQLLNIWRPPLFYKNEYGVPYAPNTTIISVQKTKPKGVGRKGTAIWEYDWKRNRYSEYIDTDTFGNENWREILDVDSYDRDKNYSTEPPF